MTRPMAIHSDLDVNVLQDAFSRPNIPAIPLPPGCGSKDFSRHWSLVSCFFRWFTSIDYDSIYLYNEPPATTKYAETFNRDFDCHMNARLCVDNEKLDKLVRDHVGSEIKLRLCPPAQLRTRVRQIKRFVIAYYSAYNKRNMPRFGDRSFLQLAYITVVSVLAKMFPDGIWVRQSLLRDLHRRLTSRPMLVLFLPNHQLHIDYIILHVILVRFQMQTPAVIAGDNLNVAVFGTFLRNLGAIFIPRTWLGDSYSEYNLGHAVEYFLMQRVPFEVFIEGARSRDGKSLLPKYGILKQVASVFQRQRQTDLDFDMLVQPVGILYERVFEADGYAAEMAGSDKKPELFATILRNGYLYFFLSSALDSPIRIDAEGFSDNHGARLSGKILVSFPPARELSRFHDSTHNRINIKQLGVFALSQACWHRRVPLIAVVGLALHMHLAAVGAKREIRVQLLVDLVRETANRLATQYAPHSMLNRDALLWIRCSNTDAIVALIEKDSMRLLRHARVNRTRHLIRLDNRSELVYFKNLTIHALFPCSLVCMLLSGGRKKSFALLEQQYRNVTQLLRNEFLADYSAQTANCGMASVLQGLVADGVLALDGGCYLVRDHQFVSRYASLVSPFVQTFVHLLPNILSLGQETCPVREMLRRVNASVSTSKGGRESLNKQYLLSAIYYLDFLGLASLEKVFLSLAKALVTYIRVRNAPKLGALFLGVQQYVIGGNPNDEVIAQILVGKKRAAKL